MQNNDDKFENLSTKIAKSQKRQIESILERMGMNIYQWLQLMCEVTIRMSSEKYNLSEEMSKLIQMFQLVPGFKDVLTLCDPNTEAEICEAVYIIQAKDKKGFKPIMVEKPFMGEWKQSENVMDIVERVIEVCNPTAYRRLRVAMTELNCSRIFEALMVLADSLTLAKLNEQTINELFSDDNRYDGKAAYGKVVEYGRKTKSKHHKTVDSQATINFDEDNNNNNN